MSLPWTHGLAAPTDHWADRVETQCHVPCRPSHQGGFHRDVPLALKMETGERLDLFCWRRRRFSRKILGL